MISHGENHTSETRGAALVSSDIRRFAKLGILETLLRDCSTEGNIIWASSSYEHYGAGYQKEDEMMQASIVGDGGQAVRIRACKEQDEKAALTKSHAEVFTPTWVCKMMIDHADEAWAQNEAEGDGLDAWQKYVGSRRLEITCGEAPYLASRYDATNGSPVPVSKRIGILDRKLALVSKNAIGREQWIEWAKKALKSTYGYEFQGDNLLIARVNILCTVEEFANTAGFFLTDSEYREFAEIISWNLWQMDGLSNCIPFGKPPERFVQSDLMALLFGDSEVQEIIEPTRGAALVYDWENDSALEFRSIAQEGKHMKFDYVIGNPPYQEESNKNGRQPPIYHLFMDNAFKCAPTVELITPARFLFDAGQTPKAWNKKMLSDKHFKVLEYWPNGADVFPTTDIKGGVAITVRAENLNYGEIGTFTVYPELNSIIDKTKDDREKIGSVSSIVSQRGLYRLTDDFFLMYPAIRTKLGAGTGNMFVSSYFDIAPEAFSDTKTDGFVKVYGRANNKRTVRFFPAKYLRPNAYFETYNLLIPKSNGSGKFGEALSQPIISSPQEGALDSFVSIGTFESKQEVLAFQSYLKTRFFRALLGVKKVTQDNPKSVWDFVPLQNFTSSSDIDWSQSVAEIDAQLYRKYDLSKEEIDFIESHVKEMD